MSYHLSLLLSFQLLMQLAQARRSGVVRISSTHQQRGPGQGGYWAREAASVVGIGDHLAGSRDIRVVELEVHEDLGSSSAAARRGDLSGDRAGGACRRGRGGLCQQEDRLCALWGFNIRREFEDRSCCRPALTAAAACKETEAVRVGVGEVEPSGCRGVADSLPWGLELADIAEVDGGRWCGGGGSGDGGGSDGGGSGSGSGSGEGSGDGGRESSLSLYFVQR